MMSSYEKRLLILLIVIFGWGGISYGSEFLSLMSLQTFAHQIPEYGLISLSLMLVMIASGLNFSVVAMTTLSGIIGAIVMDKLGGLGIFGILCGIVVMLIMGLMTGAINGGLVSYIEVPPILTTLGTMLLFQGIALIISKGNSISSFPEAFLFLGNGSVIGVPVPMICFAIVSIALHYILTQREFGRQLYRIGKSKTAAIYSGIPVKKRLFEVYMLSGLIVGIAAVIMTARYNSIRVDYGSTYLINSIVAISLGGVDIRGGRGSVIGVFLSLIIISALVRILNLGNMPPYLIDSIMGIVLLINLVIQFIMVKESKIDGIKAS